MDTAEHIHDLGTRTGMTRRQVVKGLVALGLVPAAATSCGSDDVADFVESAINLGATIANRPTRQNAVTLAPTSDTITAFGDGVAAMKALGSGDLRNWDNHVDIHANRAAHQNWLFLPWHRHYLFWFEEIIRELTGMDDFALPYWNWTEQREIPDAFLSGDLNNSSRKRDHVRNSIATNPCNENQIDNAMSPTVFTSFGSGSILASQPFWTSATQSDLEKKAHNWVHWRIGGDMRDPALSPNDPVFFLHHGMIDYLWVEWEHTLGNNNPAGTAWRGRSFSGDFVSSLGNLVTGPAADVRNSLLYPLLTYQYEDSTVGNTMGSTQAALP